MSTDYRLLSLTALTIIMWGLWGFFGKLALDRRMEPTAIFFAEIMISAACALPVLLFFSRGRDAASVYASWNIFGLLSGAGLALGLLFYYFALEKAQASIVVPLTAVYPVVTALLGYAVLGERLRPWQWLGIVLVVAGVVLLLLAPPAPTPSE